MSLFLLMIFARALVAREGEGVVVLKQFLCEPLDRGIGVLLWGVTLALFGC